MVYLPALLIAGSAAGTLASVEPARLRGVAPEYTHHYPADVETFRCITAPHVIIPRSAVNDEYCDCPDGSDEPGTSACSRLSPLSPPSADSSTHHIPNALPGFWCENKGHISSYVPSMYVNDGVCDYELCCDGSEEWAGVGGITCENRCVAMGKEYRRKAGERARGEMAALKRKQELVTEAQRTRLLVEDHIRDLEVQVRGLEEKEGIAKREFEDVERREKYRVLSGGSQKATRTTVLAKLAKSRVEELRGTLSKEVTKKEAAKSKLKQLEAILAAFKEEYNPNFNDEGVKRAVKAWEDYAATSPIGADPMSDDPDLETVQKPDSEETSGINWEEWEKEEEESDVEALYRFEAYLPPSLRSWIGEKVTHVRHLLVQNGILADTTKRDASESKAVTTARDAWNTVKSEKEARQKKINDLGSDLEKDYGPDDAFRALKDTCISINAGEYNYELCYMNKVSQKSLKNGGDTNLGSFKRLEKVTVDEDEGVDGRGLGKGERWAMVFENGQQCWNGPQRSTTVIMRCREKGEVWRVVEAEKCIYRMEVGTPAVCEEGEGNEQQVVKADVRDEL